VYLNCHGRIQNDKLKKKCSTRQQVDEMGHHAVIRSAGGRRERLVGRGRVIMYLLPGITTTYYILSLVQRSGTDLGGGFPLSGCTFVSEHLFFLLLLSPEW